MTTIRAALIATAKKFKNSSTPNLDSEVLLSFVIKQPKEFLYTYPQEKLSNKQARKLAELTKRRAAGEPIAYLLGNKEFFGLNFKVNKNVLIPRPETEIIIEEIIKSLPLNSSPLTIIEIGTGSGCIAITLAKHFPKTKIYASDICKRALKVTEANAKKHGVKINFRQGSLLEPFKNVKADILVANLPYLDIDHKNLLQSSETVGLKFEPKKALYSGPDGLDLIRELIEQINQKKNQPKTIYLEAGEKQMNAIKKIVKKYLPEYQTQIKKDLAGLDRIIILKLKTSS